MEVALALVLIGSVLSSLFLLQNTLLEGVTRFSQRLERIYLLKKRLQEAAFARLQEGMFGESSKKMETQIDQPPTRIQYEIIRPSKESALRNYKGIMIERVTAEWEQWYGTRQETMISLVYRPEKKS
jgi:hypothetical protein